MIYMWKDRKWITLNLQYKPQFLSLHITYNPYIFIPNLNHTQTQGIAICRYREEKHTKLPLSRSYPLIDSANNRQISQKF